MKEKKGTSVGILPDEDKCQFVKVGGGSSAGSRSASGASDLSSTHHYYRVSVKSMLGRKLGDYLQTCSDAEKQADAFARRYGAESYIMPSDAEAGGVGVLELTDAADVKRLVKRGWRVSYRPDENTFWLVPDVSEDTTFVVVGSDEHQRMLEQQKSDPRTLVLATHLSYMCARAFMTRYELAELAGVELAPLAVSGDDVVSPCLPSSKRTSGEERVRLLQEQMKPIREAEDRRIECILHDKSFASVTTLEGSDKAVDAYRRMMSLPVVAAGTLNGILGIGNNGVIPSCFSKGASYYLATYEPMRSPDAKTIKPDTYIKARTEALNASAAGEASRKEGGHDR